MLTTDAPATRSDPMVWYRTFSLSTPCTRDGCWWWELLIALVPGDLGLALELGSWAPTDGAKVQQTRSWTGSAVAKASR